MELNDDVEFVRWMSPEEDAKLLEELTLQEARDEGRMEVAKNLLKKDFAIKDIVEVTNLPKKEILELKKEIG